MKHKGPREPELGEGTPEVDPTVGGTNTDETISETISTAPNAPPSETPPPVVETAVDHPEVPDPKAGFKSYLVTIQNFSNGRRGEFRVTGKEIGQAFSAASEKLTARHSVAQSLGGYEVVSVAYERHL